MNNIAIVVGLLLASPIDQLAFEAKLDPHAVHRGAPVLIEISTQTVSENSTVQGVSYYHNAVEIGLMDSKNTSVHKMSAGPNRYGGRMPYRWGAMLDESGRASHSILLNEWFSNDLPEGEYTVQLSLVEAMALTQADVSVDAQGVIGQSWRSYPVNRTWALPLTILDRDDAAVRRTYDDLLKLVQEPANAKTSKRLRALETLVYAREPLALSSQLELFLQDKSLIEIDTGFDPNPYDYDLPMRFIESNSFKAASALAAYFTRIENDAPDWQDMQASSRHNMMTQVILWALHELHDQGNPDVVKIMNPIVEKHPRPRDPRPVPGLD